ncbi:TIGR03943 family putative permease subunit [Paenibacillus sp. HJGM_3]|uniref:TIGR03943 family putative permease subunit n=1 Tax=Paenibacillus sp. HJGM_3 TaxID=3379816 RepID=UPI003859D9B8
MRENRSLIGHYLLRSAIMGAFCYYIVHLVKSDHLVYYIAPRMQIYVKLAAIALFAVAVHQVYMAFRSLFEKPDSCDCGHEAPRSFLGGLLVYGLFLLPLVLAFGMPDQVMGSSIASKKGMNLSTSGTSKLTASAPTEQVLNSSTPAPTPIQTPIAAPTPTPVSTQAAVTGKGSTTAAPLSAEDQKLQELFKSEDFNEAYSKLGMKLYKQEMITFPEKGFMEILTTLDLFMDPFIGKKVEISGFVYRENEMKPNQFVIARLAMQCCSADASPYGVMVESSQPITYADDTWVKITGTIGKTKYNGYEYMKLDAKQIEKIEAPKTPYVYPDYDFLE